MNCPNCRVDDDHVIRTFMKNGVQKRRRECKYCGHRFTTVERYLLPKGIKDKG